MEKAEKTQERIAVATEFANKIIDILQVDATFKIDYNEDVLKILFDGNDSTKLIGYRGEMLNSLQYILSVILNKEVEDFCKVVLDCNDYRVKREETLKHLAKKLAEKAVRIGKPVKLEPMCPQERKVIHSELQNFEGVTTASNGNEPNRFLTIIPKNISPKFDDKNRFDNNSRGNKNFVEKRDGKFGKRGNKPFNKDKFEKKGDFKPTERKATSFLGFGSFLGNSKQKNNEKEYEKQKAAFFQSDENKVDF